MRKQCPAPIDAAAWSLEKLGRQQDRLVRRLHEADDDLAAIIDRELSQTGEGRRSIRAAIAAIDTRLSAERETVAPLGMRTDYCARVAANLEHFDFAIQRLARTTFGVRVETKGVVSVCP